MDLPTTHYDVDKPKEAEQKQEIKVEQKKDSSSKNKLQKISTYLLYAAVFLSPLVFVAPVYAPPGIIKALFLSVLIIVSAILYIWSSIGKKQIIVPRSGLAYASIGIIVSLLISVFLSTNISKSFIGQGFEIGTASFIMLMFATLVLVSHLALRNRKVVFNIYVSLFLSFIIVLLFHVARLFFGAKFLGFGAFDTLTSTMVGKWFDFAILTSLVGLLSFLGIKFLFLGKRLKLILSIALFICGAMLFIIDFKLAWIAIAIIVFIIGIYEFYKRPVSSDPSWFKKIASRISLLTLAVFIISILCVWKGDLIYQKVTTSPKLNLTQEEVVLPWQYTLDVSADSLKQSPIFGAGPNRFNTQFLLYRPYGINTSGLWGNEFINGFGNLPTFLVTQGLVGFVLWVLFLILFAKNGISLLKRTEDPTKKFFVTSSFFLASFLWLVNIIYIPSHVIIFLTFVFTGIFVACLIEEGLFPEKNVANEGTKVGKYSLAIYSIVIILLIIWLGLYVKKVVAVTLFQKGITEFQQNIKDLNTGKTTDVSKAENKFKSTLLWDTSDVYYQALAETDILRINILAQEVQNQLTKNPSQPADDAKIKKIGELMNEAFAYAQKAIALDPTNYYNYISEARIAEIGTVFKFPNAYESTKNAYSRALNVNPFNPVIFLNLARLEASQGKYTEAQQYIGQAIQLKQNYIDAIFLLSQIQVQNGQTKDAIISTQVASQLNPKEPVLFFQLGLLQYNDKNYSEAAGALSKAVELNGQYANARYFLGLSYARLGKNEDAIKQFVELTKTNPDNEEVKFILSNLQTGKSPFQDVQPPIDSKPEKRKTLPISEVNPKDSSKK